MLRAKLQQEQIAAMKSGDKLRLETIRFLFSQIKNKEVDLKRELTDEEVVTAARKFSKELKESSMAFEKGAREDLLETAQKQLQIVSEFLPAEVSDDELEKLVKELFESHKDTLKESPKKIIGICVAGLKNKVDPTRISAICQKLLQQ